MATNRIDLGDLARMQRDWAALLPTGGFAQAFGMMRRDDGTLVEAHGVGVNPGHLRMLYYVPASLPPGAPLVVVLHGCGQDAGGYNTATGWSTLAKRHGFALLCPEQNHVNNPHNCFNWYEPEDVSPGCGEIGSIREMVAAMLADHGCDPARVYVTGLSAGGAMTAALLAVYPDVFAGGAIIAGPPFGAATGARDAMATMAHCPSMTAADWGAKVRAVSPDAVRRPTVALWHGDADTTVTPGNAIESAKQWTNVHGLNEAAGVESRIDGIPFRMWRDAAGRECVTLYAVPGLGHGAPITPGESGDRGVGQTERFVLASGISSTWQIARSWGLVPALPVGPALSVQPIKSIGSGLRTLVEKLF